MMKRPFDIVAATAALFILSPLLGLAALLIKLDSPGPVFFKQERIGRSFRPFWIYKFRTMVRDASTHGGLITVGEDRRITRIGRILRKTKFDEIAQLMNIIKREIEIVDPRQENTQY